MQPNFEEMTTPELRVYALAHRDEIETLRAIYQRRSSDSEAVWFHPPKTKEKEIQQLEVLKSFIDKREKSNTDYN
jgi:hypothetical protein